MIISIDEGKVFDSFMIKKTLNKQEVKENYLNIIKILCEKPTVNIIFNGEGLKAFPLRSGTRQRCAVSPLLLTQYWRS